MKNSGAPGRSSRSQAFTLIEIMIVVGMIGLIMSMGVPTLYNMLHRHGMAKAVSGVRDLCLQARANAILHGTTTAIIFHPKERRCELDGGAAAELAQLSTAGTGSAVRFEDQITIEGLGINQRDYTDVEVGRVRFFPNGTCDEMTLILRSDQNEWRKISLEITTGLPWVDSDPMHWKTR